MKRLRPPGHVPQETVYGKAWQVQSRQLYRLSRARRLPSIELSEQRMGKCGKSFWSGMRRGTHVEYRLEYTMLLYPSTRDHTRAPCPLLAVSPLPLPGINTPPDDQR